jgi:hypothetical protein
MNNVYFSANKNGIDTLPSTPFIIKPKKVFDMVKVTKSSPVFQRNGVKKVCLDCISVSYKC